MIKALERRSSGLIGPGAREKRFFFFLSADEKKSYRCCVRGMVSTRMDSVALFPHIARHRPVGSFEMDRNHWQETRGWKFYEGRVLGPKQGTKNGHLRLAALQEPANMAFSMVGCCKGSYLARAVL